MDTNEFELAPADGERDLDGILELQRANLRGRLPAEQQLRDGFVTVEHTRAISARNGRSLRAHERVGFSVLTKYRDELDEWVVAALALR